MLIVITWERLTIFFQNQTTWLAWYEICNIYMMMSWYDSGVQIKHFSNLNSQKLIENQMQFSKGTDVNVEFL